MLTNYYTGQKIVFVIQRGLRVMKIQGVIIDADKVSDIYAIRGQDGNTYLVTSRHIIATL